MSFLSFVFFFVLFFIIFVSSFKLFISLVGSGLNIVLEEGDVPCKGDGVGYNKGEGYSEEDGVIEEEGSMYDAGDGVMYDIFTFVLFFKLVVMLGIIISLVFLKLVKFFIGPYV